MELQDLIKDIFTYMGGLAAVITLWIYTRDWFKEFIDWLINRSYPRWISRRALRKLIIKTLKDSFRDGCSYNDLQDHIDSMGRYEILCGQYETVVKQLKMKGKIGYSPLLSETRIKLKDPEKKSFSDFIKDLFERIWGF